MTRCSAAVASVSGRRPEVPSLGSWSGSVTLTVAWRQGPSEKQGGAGYKRSLSRKLWAASTTVQRRLKPFPGGRRRRCDARQPGVGRLKQVTIEFSPLLTVLRGGGAAHAHKRAHGRRVEFKGTAQDGPGLSLWLSLSPFCTWQGRRIRVRRPSDDDQMPLDTQPEIGARWLRRCMPNAGGGRAH